MAGRSEQFLKEHGVYPLGRVHHNRTQAIHGGRIMLVLTRRVGEEIVINGNIRVVVTAVKGDKVRIGVSAPASVPVDRQEVHERRAQFEYECDWAQPAPTC
jgi:carbon storage regulator